MSLHALDTDMSARCQKGPEAQLMSSAQRIVGIAVGSIKFFAVMVSLNFVGANRASAKCVGGTKTHIATSRLSFIRWLLHVGDHMGDGCNFGLATPRRAGTEPRWRRTMKDSRMKAQPHRLAIVVRNLTRLVAACAPMTSWVVGSGAGQAAAQPVRTDDNNEHRVTAHAVSNLCTPIFGSGKSAGVPIVVQDANGNPLTDVTGLTFELTDGTNTQDVTSLIKRPEEQLLITGQALAAPYLGNSIGPITGTYDSIGNALGTTTAPTLDFSNPGHFFLDCTPDVANASTKFAAGMTLRTKSGGTIISSGSVAGRSASYMSLDGYVSTSTPISYAITPSDASNLDFQKLYQDVIALTGLRLRAPYAALVIAQASNGIANSTYCWSDLVTKSGSAWTWSAQGQSFLSELTSTSGTSFPILDSRAKGTAGPTDTGLSACSQDLAPLEDDLFMHIMAAQLLLFDGPRGNVPTSISNTVDALRAAVVLRPVVAPTTTSVPNQPVTDDADVSEVKDLPSTGSRGFDTMAGAVATLSLGGVLVLASRRRLQRR